jgi:hypothetical protein
LSCFLFVRRARTLTHCSPQLSLVVGVCREAKKSKYQILTTMLVTAKARTMRCRHKFSSQSLFFSLFLYLSLLFLSLSLSPFLSLSLLFLHAAHKKDKVVKAKIFILSTQAGWWKVQRCCWHYLSAVCLQLASLIHSSAVKDALQG